MSGHDFYFETFINAWFCRDCGHREPASFSPTSMKASAPCPGPKASAPPVPKQHQWLYIGRGKQCSDCSVEQAFDCGAPCDPGNVYMISDPGSLYFGHYTNAPRPSPGPSPAAPPAPQAAVSMTATSLLGGSPFIIWDEAPDAPPLAVVSGPPTCPACDIELCPVIDEFAGVLGPFCARCRR
jgi:hypothetical protein